MRGGGGEVKRGTDRRFLATFQNDPKTLIMFSTRDITFQTRVKQIQLNAFKLYSLSTILRQKETPQLPRL